MAVVPDKSKKSKEKVSKSKNQAVVKEEIVEEKKPRTPAKMSIKKSPAKLSPRKTRSGPRGAVVESPPKIGKK
jgi:hypothetical protein